MKTNQKTYNQRLGQFADYLASQVDPPDKEFKSYMLYDRLKNGEQIRTGIIEATWVLNYLPLCFEDIWWYDNLSGEPTMDEGDGSKIISVFNFFGIETTEEYRQLFGARSQHLKYGSKIITEDSPILDYAENIIEFIKYKGNG